MANKKFKQNDNNLAIAYYRYSSHAQNETSIDQQREQAHAYADAHGYKIVKEYEDAAISGTTADRPGFQAMLSEVDKIRPSALIMWKADRLGRDVAIVAVAKQKIRDAGCVIEMVAEMSPDDSAEGTFLERLLDAQAEFYSRQLAQNIRRGMDYNAKHALYNGHKLLGYTVDDNKKYVIDPKTAPIVQRIFADYSYGKSMIDIVDDLDKQGIRSVKGNKITHNSLRKILHNRAYIGEYKYGEHVIKDGMPVLVDEATFEKVQERFALNKRKGAQKVYGLDDDGAPRYWLTGKLYCGECGETMQGVSGTGKNGRKHFYYYCKSQRKKKCAKKPVKKEWIEEIVMTILEDLLHKPSNLESLAVDAAEYYDRTHKDTGYLDSLEAKRKEVEKSIANIINAIEKGLFSNAIQERLQQLEEQKNGLNDAIAAENIRQSLYEDQHSIQAYFSKYMHVDFENAEMRDSVLEYFVDKIFLYDDKLVITSWFCNDRKEIEWEELEYEFDMDARLERELREDMDAIETSMNEHNYYDSDDGESAVDETADGHKAGVFECSALSST